MMTKTQTQLLENARKYGGTYSVTTAYGRGPQGGRRNYGARERDALFALEKMGIVVITQRTPWEEYNRGYKQSGNVLAFKIVA